MKKYFLALIMVVLVSGIGKALEIDLDINVEPEEAPPELWISDYTIDPTDRDGYAFEGEIVSWNFLARSNNGAEDIKNILITLRDVWVSYGEGCVYEEISGYIPFAETNFNPLTDVYGVCYLDVKDAYGETVVNTNLVTASLYPEMITNGFPLFYNPILSLNVDSPIIEINGKPGDQITKEVNVDLLVEDWLETNIYISGEDFYDFSNPSAMCPTTNKFSLENILYSTNQVDYYSIYPTETLIGTFSTDFVLSMLISIPTPCVGNFDSGNIYLTAELV